MSGEFYEVTFVNGISYFFRNKDKAFDFLWQEFLNGYADEYSDEGLAAAKEDMYFWYVIEGVGEVVVRGFED